MKPSENANGSLRTSRRLPLPEERKLLGSLFLLLVLLLGLVALLVLLVAFAAVLALAAGLLALGGLLLGGLVGHGGRNRGGEVASCHSGDQCSFDAHVVSSVSVWVRIAAT